MAITDAVCIPAKCGKTSRDFYMMYYKAFDGKWVLTYGKKELPRSSGGAGNAVAVKLDSVRTGPQYKCPHCGQKYTFKCWNCGKSTCYDGDDHDGCMCTLWRIGCISHCQQRWWRWKSKRCIWLWR